jgi:transcription antitermination factor NusG
MEPTAFLVRHRQDDQHCDWERAVRGTDFAVGERVRIVSGPLAGLCGVLKAQAKDGKWVLDASAAARGVLICIRGQQLTRDS